MNKLFFPILKNYFLIIFLNFSNYYCQTPIESFLSKSLYSENKKNTPIKINSVYCHNKFCKRINIYYYTTINQNNALTLYLLLMDNADSEQKIIPNNEILTDKFQWQCFIKNNESIIYPNNIIKKEVDQNDIIIFGEKNIPFGSLYKITFDINNISDNNTLFHLFQYDKEFIICLHF